ncbi:DUF4292 domain-containing protein [Oligoflexia bacterium]|nr:DUF4292 domain-containing protein [Oligoflexia bacterium]
MKMVLQKLLIACIAVLLCHCTMRGYVPRPKLTGARLTASEQQRVLSELMQSERAIRSFRALSRSKLTQDRKTHSVRHVFVFNKPAQLRIETLPSVGTYTLNLFVSDQGQGVGLDTVSKQALLSDSSAKFMRKAIGIFAPAADIMSFLTGTLPMSQLELDTEGELQMYFNEEQNLYSFVRGPFQLYATIDADTFSLRTLQLRDHFNEQLLLDVTYGQYVKVDKLWLPKDLVIVVPKEDLTLALRLSPISVNGDYPEKLFKVIVPEDYEIWK